MYFDYYYYLFIFFTRTLQSYRRQSGKQTNNSNSWTDQPTISTFRVHRRPNNNNSIFRRIFIIELTAKCSCGIIIWSNFVELGTFCESRYECMRWRVVDLIWLRPFLLSNGSLESLVKRMFDSDQRWPQFPWQRLRSLARHGDLWVFGELFG